MIFKKDFVIHFFYIFATFKKNATYIFQYVKTFKIRISKCFSKLSQKLLISFDMFLYANIKHGTVELIWTEFHPETCPKSRIQH